MTPPMVIPVTAVVPMIPVRANTMYPRALSSIDKQIWAPQAIEVEMDVDHTGAAATRNRVLERVKTPWVAFLDDDDEWLPGHLRTLWDAAQDHPEADVIYTGCEVVDPDGRWLPHEEHLPEWGNFGEPFDAELLRERSYLPVTSLVRTSLAQRAQFGPPPGSIYDDWGFYLRLLDLGAQFLHVPVRTWIWYHHGANTSGQGDRW